jgi:hypothetical protein
MVQRVKADDTIKCRVREWKTQSIPGNKLGASGIDARIHPDPFLSVTQYLRIEIQRHCTVPQSIEPLRGIAGSRTELQNEVARLAVKCLTGDCPVENIVPGCLMGVRHQGKPQG